VVKFATYTRVYTVVLLTLNMTVTGKDKNVQFKHKPLQH